LLISGRLLERAAVAGGAAGGGARRPGARGVC